MQSSNIIFNQIYKNSILGKRGLCLRSVLTKDFDFLVGCYSVVNDRCRQVLYFISLMLEIKYIVFLFFLISFVRYTSSTVTYIFILMRINHFKTKFTISVDRPWCLINMGISHLHDEMLLHPIKLVSALDCLSRILSGADDRFSILYATKRWYLIILIYWFKYFTFVFS